MRVQLNRLPAYNKTYVVDFPRFDGGLNIRDLNYRLELNQSPNMSNLWWQDGVLQCRDGQTWLSALETYGTGYACYERLFWGRAFFHIGTKLYWGDPAAGPAVVSEEETAENTFTLVEIFSGLPENRGTFFRYLDDLYYKNKGGFIRISYDPEDPDTPFSAVSMTGADEAYTPVIVINASPANGGGTAYQPENRLSPRKEIWYNALAGTAVYRLPVTSVDAVLSVTVNGEAQTEGTDYTVDTGAGTVTFTSAPDPGTPAANNTVRITYSKVNPDALNSVMGCNHAIVAGNGNNLCILLAGCEAQPNVVFWNSNDSLGMNPGYWPMSYYNLCGVTGDAVTGFGKQYSDLILFKERSVGKLEFTVEQVDGRDSISFTYQNINAMIGCDLPWSIQLIENNLVFCNRSRGVYLVQSSSAAYENNIVCISENVNGHGDRGLLADIRGAELVVSTDDTSHYWLEAGGHVYLWDYEHSTAFKPSWYFFTDIHAVSYFTDEENCLYHLDAAGRVTRFERVFSDYGEGINKVFALPTQYFGGYDRLKDVLYTLLVVRSDTDTEIQLRYDTDYEKRVDLTPALSYSWRLSPRNLAHRCLAPARFGNVAKRTPGCRHVRHFSMILGNRITGEDLAIISAQIFYRYSGKER